VDKSAFVTPLNISLLQKGLKLAKKLSTAYPQGM